MIGLIQQRELLFAWTIRTVRARYQQSLLGALWAIIQPAATVVIFSVIFTRIIPVDTGDTPYPIFSYTAMVPWVFFSTSLGDMTTSLIANISLVTKIYFPREILPIAAMLARLVDAGVAWLLLLLLMVIYGEEIYLPGLLFFPVIVFVQMILTTGLGLCFSAINVFYRDVRHIVTLVLQLWLYATPIIYPITLIPDDLLPFYYLNPMAGIIESYRAVLLYQQLPEWPFLFSIGVSTCIFIFGYWLFKKVEFQFADVV